MIMPVMMRIMMPRLRGNGRESSFYVISPIITHDLNAITGQHLRVEKKKCSVPGKTGPLGENTEGTILFPTNV